MKKLLIAAIAISVMVTNLFGSLKKAIPRPKAVLVMLSTENRRIEFFKSMHDRSYLKAVIRDAEEIRTVTMNDFTDNFKACPVYFFMDTLQNEILAKHFAHNIFSFSKQKGVQFSDIALPQDLIIVYYGRPVASKEVVEPNAPFLAPHTSEELKLKDTGLKQDLYGFDPQCNGLIICDDSLQQLDFVCHLVYRKLLHITGIRKEDPKYNYVSKKFDMQYYSMAAVLDEKLSPRGVNKKLKN